MEEKIKAGEGEHNEFLKELGLPPLPIALRQKLHCLRRSGRWFLMLQAHNQRFNLEEKLIGIAATGVLD